MGGFSESIEVKAPWASVWDVLADIGAIAAGNPGVEHSEETSVGEVGVGSTRYCQLSGKNNLHEEVERFEPRKSLSIRITKTNLPFGQCRYTIRAIGDSWRHRCHRITPLSSTVWSLRSSSRSSDCESAVPSRNAQSTERFKVVCREVTREPRRAIGPKRRMVIGCC